MKYIIIPLKTALMAVNSVDDHLMIAAVCNTYFSNPFLTWFFFLFTCSFAINDKTMFCLFSSDDNYAHKYDTPAPPHYITHHACNISVHNLFISPTEVDHKQKQWVNVIKDSYSTVILGLCDHSLCFRLCPFPKHQRLFTDWVLGRACLDLSASNLTVHLCTKLLPWLIYTETLTFMS